MTVIDAVRETLDRALATIQESEPTLEEMKLAVEQIHDAGVILRAAITLREQHLNGTAANIGRYEP